MNRLYQEIDPEDFQARIRFFSIEEGGRRKYPNGIRFDFMYQDNLDNLYMIYPDFFDEKENSFSEDYFLPLGEWLNARMYILVSEMRDKIHKQNIQQGVKFYCMDGPRRVAEGIVTKLVKLNE